jgi:hypothetical protein
LANAISHLKQKWCLPYNQILAEEKSAVVHFNPTMAQPKIVDAAAYVALQDGSKIPAVKTTRHIGLNLDDQLDFSEFLRGRVVKARQMVGALVKLGHQSRGLSRDLRLMSVKNVLLPTLTFSAIAWAPLIPTTKLAPLNSQWICALRWAGGMHYTVSESSVLVETGFMPLDSGSAPQP